MLTASSSSTMYSPRPWGRGALDAMVSLTTKLVFALLDLLDTLLCLFYRFADSILDGNGSQCYWGIGGTQAGDCDETEEEEVSETLYGRKNMFREMGLLKLKRRRRDGGGEKSDVHARPRWRWSDCGCELCVAWQLKEEQKLHFVVREPSQGPMNENCQSNSTENVIFLHGFLSSSSFWVETVFKNLSEHSNRNCRLFAVDLLGFGESPKPTECLYRLKDHVQMIEQSVIQPFKLKSYHLVAHSMGCILALALAAKHPDSIKSVTLVAPPYFPSPREKAGHIALNRLAERKLWPPMLFASAFMSWYEHLGRSVCFLICRNHRKWECLLKLITGRRKLHFTIVDLTRHTHHSAWYSMHNVICGGAKFMDENLEILNRSGAFIKIIHGDRDQVVPPECSSNIKLKVPHSKLQTIPNANHNTVVFGREGDFTRDLEETWFTSAK